MRKIIPLLLALVLALTGISAFAQEDISGRLVLYSSMTDNDLNNLIDSFGELYPDVEIEIVNGSGGELLARIRAEKENPQGDVMWGALSNSDGDTHSDLFLHWLSEYEDEIMDDYKSGNGFYNLDHLSTVVFAVNVELEKELGLDIRTYEDLLDPKLSGRIYVADPNSSSSAWNNLSNIFAVYGNDSPEAWAIVEGLMKNKMVIGTSSSVAFKGVNDGEYVVGLTYEDGAATLLKAGSDQIRIQYPENGASAFAFGVAVIQGAQNEAAAKALVSYLMSAEGQSDLGTRLGTLRFTNKNAQYDTPYLPKSEEIKWVYRDMDWLTQNREDILKKWNELYAANY
ncbi:MAG TPA: extracellular solute-binding protein [Clostridia bacterium]|nr:extracellular solute-binding protein [Clostridia bacterium]